MISDGAVTGIIPVVMMIIMVLLICLLKMMKNNYDEGLALCLGN